MRHNVLAALLLVLAAVTASAADAAPKLVWRVDKVTAAIINNRLVVSTSGAVNSGGWTMPRLSLQEVRVPESDTEVFEFLATPPPQAAVVIQALLPVQITAVFPLPHYATVQVKVQAASNAVTAPIAQTAPAAPR